MALSRRSNGGIVRVWDLSNDVVSFHVTALVADIGLGAGLVALVSGLTEWWRRSRPRRWWQFSIGELLAVTALVAVATFVWVSDRREQRHVIEWAQSDPRRLESRF